MKIQRIIAIFLTLTIMVVQTTPVCSFAEINNVSSTKTSIIKKNGSNGRKKTKKVVNKKINQSINPAKKVVSQNTNPPTKKAVSKKTNHLTKPAKKVVSKKTNQLTKSTKKVVNKKNNQSIKPTQKTVSQKTNQPAKKAVSKKTINNSEKKPTIIRKIINNLEKLLKWSLKNVDFYGLLTVAIIYLADRVGLVNKSKILKDVSNTSLEDIKKYFNKGFDNACSIPQCISEINSAFKGTNSSEFCNGDADINAVKSATCNFTKFINTLNQQMSSSDQKSWVIKISETLRQAGNSGGDDIIKFWDDTRYQRRFMYVGSFLGSILGGIGSLFGFTNFGFLYGTVMGLTLYNCKTDKGVLEVTANAFEFADKSITYVKNLTSMISN